MMMMVVERRAKWPVSRRFVRTLETSPRSSAHRAIVRAKKPLRKSFLLPSSQWFACPCLSPLSRPVSLSGLLRPDALVEDVEGPATNI